MKTLFLSLLLITGFSSALSAQSTQKDTSTRKDTNQFFGEIIPVSKDTGRVYSKVEQMPYFINGNIATFIENNLNYPPSLIEADITGTVIVEFVVNTDSTVSQVKSRSPNTHRLLQEEAVRIIKLTNKHWAPGKQNGKPVKVISRIPIEFMLEDE